MSAGAALAVKRLISDAEPDLERDVGGYAIRLYFVPCLKYAVRAVVEVHAGPVIIDMIEVPASEGYDAYAHPTRWSSAYTEALR